MRVRDPLAAWLRPGPAAPPAEVAARLARALLPPMAPDPAPDWLREDQRLSFARALAAARRHGGALLADRAGTGKSWIGLAVATRLLPGPAVQVLAPAVLRGQWHEVARRAGVTIRFHSHELLSRGRLPEQSSGPVILDESHRFRNPATRRYQTVAPWCVGRRGILLSATPAVNRLGEVVHQLHLLIRDDALARVGEPKRRGAEPPEWGATLAQLVVTGEDRTILLPARTSRDIRSEEPAGSPATRLQEGIASLRLSADRGTAGLLRVSLLAALASSPLAVAEALGRYRALLLHARDAAESGITLSRHAIRRFIGWEGDQLVLWPLVAEFSNADLALDDLGSAGALESLARSWSAEGDTKVSSLAGSLADGKPALVFTGARATVKYLRSHLGRGVAWCTGAGAGIDALGLPREAVLDWFRRRELRTGRSGRPPTSLIATDVASEGLDLTLIERVIHYDLPWTAVRLDQRSGRAFRLGGRQTAVEIVRFLPSRLLESALRREAILELKSELPEAIGLGDGPDAPWKVRARIAARWRSGPGTSGLGAVDGPPGRVVAGIRIEFTDGAAEELVLARTPRGWTDDGAAIEPLLERARSQRALVPTASYVRSVLRDLAVPVRAVLRTVEGTRLPSKDRTEPVRRLRRRLLGLAREAARARDESRLRLLERGIRLLRRGHTAGESRQAEEWSSLPVPDLLLRLGRLPAESARPEVSRVELIGLLLFTRDRQPG